MYRLNAFLDRSICCVALAATLASTSVYAERPQPRTASAPTDAEKSSAATAQPVADSPDGASSSNQSAGSGMESAVLSDAPTHLLIGRSAYVTSQKRLSRVYITNPNVLSAYTATPNEVLVTAKEPGVSSLMIWDESGETHTYFYSADTETSLLESVLKSALPNENIKVQAEGSRILLSGTVGNVTSYQTAEKLAGQYSKDVSNAIVVNPATSRQVRLHVRIVEVDRTKLEQMGFNLFSAGGNTLATSSTSQFPSSLTTTTGSSSGSSGSTNNTYTVGGKTVSVTNPLNFLLYSADLNLGAMIQDLEQRNVLQILAEPNITTLSGEKANFLAGGEFPFPVVQGGVSGLTSITVQFRPYGVKLEFLPQINTDGSIDLKVAPEVSALDYTNAVQISGYTIPAISSRRADTEVVLRDGQTFAISGLLDQRTTDQLGRTPGAASIPIIGNLFKSKNINHSTSELLVLVTPEIVDPSKEQVKEPALAVKMLDRPVFDQKMQKSTKH
ncbi:type II and III secretion system protein family protein [Terriglobus roseus]|uniref:Pilus assembly protein CpaC n=1 Tax=Terriglobus roseus TaxID=392734 RepID=A0A1G7PBE2_9BACT|nr:pilus assembly protein N-terminal domain-containing protein [Terriglobus roseus]SDF83603.1 pilus assembly protein CpaC [Terriglobus roseus]